MTRALGSSNTKRVAVGEEPAEETEKEGVVGKVGEKQETVASQHPNREEKRVSTIREGPALLSDADASSRMGAWN